MSMSDWIFTSVSAGAIDSSFISVPVSLIRGRSATFILPGVKQAFITHLPMQALSASSRVSAT
jgi:hypothetical protein